MGTSVRSSCKCGETLLTNYEPTIIDGRWHTLADCGVPVYRTHDGRDPDDVRAEQDANYVRGDNE